MSRLVAAAVVGVLALPLVASGPAPPPCHVLASPDAGDGRAPVRVCEQRVYLQARGRWGSGRIGNVGATAGPATTPTWGPRPPQRPLGPWSGAVALSAPPTDDAPGGAAQHARRAGGAVFAGGSVGNLDSLAVELFISAPGHLERGAVAVAAGPSPVLHDAHGIPARIALRIGGVELMWRSEILLYDPPHAPAGTFIGRFAISGLWDGRDRPRAVRSLRLGITTERTAEDEAVVLFDADEVPSSIHFNRRDLTGFTRLRVRQAESRRVSDGRSR